MQTTRTQLRQMARDQLKGSWLWVIGLWILPPILVNIVTAINNWIWTGRFEIDEKMLHLFWWKQSGVGLIGFIIGLAALVISYGVIYSQLAFRDTGKKPNIFKAIFAGFTNGYLFRTLITSILVNIFLCLWTILLIIPGIIKGFSYSMTPYIMKDMIDAHHKMSFTEAIRQSRKLMKGHKTDLFILWLSFNIWYFIIGVIGLVFFTINVESYTMSVLITVITAVACWIASFYIQTYYRQTVANFYRDLAGDKFLNGDY